MDLMEDPDEPLPKIVYDRNPDDEPENSEDDGNLDSAVVGVSLFTL
jgi:hypothetical protein